MSYWQISLQLIAIRSVLLPGDSIRCNQLLVSKYPDSVDVRHVISLALHIHEPLKYNRPGGSSFKVGTMWMQDVTSMKGKAVGLGSSRRKNGNSWPSSSANRIPQNTIANDHSETKMVDVVGDRKALSGAKVAMTNHGLPAYVASSTPDNGFEVLGRELPQSWKNIPRSPTALSRRMRLLRGQRQEFLDSADLWVGKLSSVGGILSNHEEKEPDVGQALKSVAEVRDFIKDIVSTAKDDAECEDEFEDDEGLEIKRPDLLHLDASVAYDVLDDLETGRM